MSAPDCTCAIVWDAIKQAEVIRKCALCRAAAQMYEALLTRSTADMLLTAIQQGDDGGVGGLVWDVAQDWKLTGLTALELWEHFARTSEALTTSVLTAARGETERVR